MTRRNPPGVAYWWPAIPAAVALTALAVAAVVSFTSWHQVVGALKLLGGGMLVGAFVLCPIRDWFLDHRWPDRG